MTYWKYSKMGPFWASLQSMKCSMAGGKPSVFSTRMGWCVRSLTAQ